MLAFIITNLYTIDYIRDIYINWFCLCLHFAQLDMASSSCCLVSDLYLHSPYTPFSSPPCFCLDCINYLPSLLHTNLCVSSSYFLTNISHFVYLHEFNLFFFYQMYLFFLATILLILFCGLVLVRISSANSSFQLLFPSHLQM